MRRIVVLGVFLLACGPAVADPPVPVELLRSTPPTCVAERFGRISVQLGSPEPNTNTGMAPTPVSYQKAFAKLQKAAGERGGHAVVLRAHEAKFYTKGTRVAQRPTFVKLSGDVVTMKRDLQGCRVVPLDVAQFVDDALQQEREQVTLHTSKN